MRYYLKPLIATALIFASIFPVSGEGSVPVIPLPLEVRTGEGVFELNGKTIRYADELSSEAGFLASKLSDAGYELPVKQGKFKASNSIILRVDAAAGKPESYTLEITPRRVIITGADKAGLFYGITTLLQLVDGGERRGVLQCATIVDEPRFAWRGFMLDEARHFFGQQKVMQILDLMASFKLNKFHWHLSDSEGWRVQIEQYPLLTSVGGYGSYSEPDGKELNFYTKEQIRQIIEYAAERHIEIIPEIDMPGHANAALRAYPQYSGGVSEKYGEFTFNPGNEATYAFLGGVLRELAELFPSQYMNIGGDEVAYGIESWNRDSLVQRLMRREGFTTLRQAEKFFIDRMSDTVRSLGKKLVGWDELTEIGASPTTTILWWRHNKPEVLRSSLHAGYPVIICPRIPCYLDFIQDANHKWGRIWSGDFNPLRRLYDFPDEMLRSMEIPPRQTEHIIGMQANIWTERIPYAKRLDFMIWPRLCALAESAWTSEPNKDFAGFERRLEQVYALMDRLGIYYYDHRDPERHPEPVGYERGVVNTVAPANFKD